VAAIGPDELERFGREGYLVLRGVVPEDLLAAADSEIDRVLEEVAPNEGDRGPGANLWFLPRSQLPACDQVLSQGGVLDLASAVVAQPVLELAFGIIQVATTVPPWPHRPGGPHIDGHGPAQDPPASFTLLAGVLLTDQSAPQSGNLWVWPGSHIRHQELFRRRGTRVLQATGGHATLLDPPEEFGDPVEVTGRRGDVVLAHFLLGHNKGGNTAEVVRRTIYYRLSAPGHTAAWESTFLDALHEYPAVAAAMTARRS